MLACSVSRFGGFVASQYQRCFGLGGPRAMWLSSLGKTADTTTCTCIHSTQTKLNVILAGVIRAIPYLEVAGIVVPPQERRCWQATLPKPSSQRPLRLWRWNYRPNRKETPSPVPWSMTTESALSLAVSASYIGLASRYRETKLSSDYFQTLEGAARGKVSKDRPTTTFEIRSKLISPRSSKQIAFQVPKLHIKYDIVIYLTTCVNYF